MSEYQIEVLLRILQDKLKRTPSQNSWWKGEKSIFQYFHFFVLTKMRK